MIATLALALACGLPASPAPGTPEAEVAAFQRELVIALRQGDRADLERLIADGFIFVHSTGGLDTRKEYIDNTVSAAQAGRSFDLERLEGHVQIYDGHTAVFTGRSVLHGRGDDIPLRSTHVYVKRGGKWQWAAASPRVCPTGRRRGYGHARPARRLRGALRGGAQPRADRERTGRRAEGVAAGFREAELIPRTDGGVRVVQPGAEPGVAAPVRARRRGRRDARRVPP